MKDQISPSYVHLLRALHTATNARLDVFGRLEDVSGPQPRHLPGDAPSWLWLVAHGFVVGAAGYLALSHRGIAIVDENDTHDHRDVGC